MAESSQHQPKDKSTLAYHHSNGGGVHSHSHHPNNNHQDVIPPRGSASGGVGPHVGFGQPDLQQDLPYVPTFNHGNGIGGGPVLALNPSNNQFHQKYDQLVQPWWMWVIAVVDIILSVLSACRVAYNIATAKRFTADRDILMWVFLMVFISIAIKGMMGICLVIGLKSTNIATKLWVCQGWLCGSYFLIGVASFMFVIQLVGTSPGDTRSLLLIILLIIYVCMRVLFSFLVKLFMRKLSERCEESAAAKERYLHYYHHQQQQQQPLLEQFQMTQPTAVAQYGQHHQQQHHHHQQQQNQSQFYNLDQEQLQYMQQHNPHQQPNQQSRGSVMHNDNLYLIPQLSALMIMLNNDYNDPGSAAN